MLGTNPLFTGTQVNYCLVCPRKLWLFSHDLDMEHTPELVMLGKLIHEASYGREKKKILIERIKIDFSGKEGVINEIKKSSKLEAAHRYQLLFTTSNRRASHRRDRLPQAQEESDREKLYICKKCSYYELCYT